MVLLGCLCWFFLLCCLVNDLDVDYFEEFVFLNWCFVVCIGGDFEFGVVYVDEFDFVVG